MGRDIDIARTDTARTDTAAPTTTRRRARGLAVVASACVLISGCGGDDEAAGDRAVAGDTAEAASITAVGEIQGGDAVAFDDTAAAEDSGTATPVDLGSIGRDVIVEMQVAMSSDDIAVTVSTITARASALGGGVASSNVDYGDPADPAAAAGFATLVVKVPPDAVDDLIGGLGQTGTVRSISQSAQDVTDQLVDLEVRIANARQSVANVRGFMEQTQNLTELVTLEAELTRRQTELEQLEAQQRNITDRVALSTITIGIVPTAAVPEREGDDGGGIADAFEEGWSAFRSVVFGIVVVLATLAPFLVAGGVLVGVAWLVARRHRERVPVTESVIERDGEPSPTG